jgi:hypothetical protein
MWDGTTLSILYDNGIGAVTPYQVNHRNDTATTNKPLGDGTVTTVELIFTTQDWDSNYTIPVTHVFARMYKVGSPTGTITASVQTLTGVELASQTISTAVENIVTDTDGEEYEAVFDIASATSDMEPDRPYKVVLAYDNGDAGNYVNVKAVDASTPILSVKPGKPPKSVYGIVHQDRLHCIEGVSGDNPSYRWYCAAGNHLDWSTPDGGGYTPVIDSSSTNYPIGGLASWNNSLWVFGTARQPFLGKQTGASPSEWAINQTMQKVSGHYKSIVVTPDDIVFLHPAGVDNISAVETSADIVAESQTDSIRRTVQQYYTAGAVAGYDPEWGTYVLQMEDSPYLYVVNCRAKSIRYNGRKQTAFSPVTRWQFAFSGNPTAFGRGNGVMLIGTDDGKVYKMDKGALYDDGNDITFKVITASYATQFGEAQAWRIGYRIFSGTGARANITFYRNYSRDLYTSDSLGLPITSDILTLDLDELFTVDADIYASTDAYFDRENVNFNFRNLMIGVEDIKLYDDPLYISDITLDVRNIGGL